VKVFDTGSLTTPNCECVYLLSDYVNGITLRDHFEKARIDIGFLEALLLELLDFLRELEQVKLQHGDLHAGNILIEDRREALSGFPFGIRITDFGVAPATSTPLLDDYEQVAVILRDALELIEADYATLQPEDRVIFNFLQHDFLGKRLLERDSTFDARCRNPRELADSLRQARSTALSQVMATTKRTLSSPFDYQSCEQLGEYHALLKELYSDKMLGLPAIEDVNNLVLTGPRGCGKTTVYRSLSLRHRILTQDDQPEKIVYIGIYYRCDDLWFLFPRYTLPTRQEAWDVPVHFLTATLLAELLEALSIWLANYFSGEWERIEALAADAVWKVLELDPPKSPSANTFTTLARALRAERDRAARKQRFANDPKQGFGVYFRPDVLPKACAVLLNHFSALSTRPIYFLVDDYSSPKITDALQQNLNRLVMLRNSSCFFKLATESPASYESRDVDGKAYVEGREFKLVNLGMDFINAEAIDRLRFVDDVFNKRFRYAEDFPIKSLDVLLGDDPESRNNNEIARKLRGGKRWRVWGRHSLGEICSGDVHFLIGLVSKMVTLHGGPTSLRVADDKPVISPEIQNEAIRAEGGNFLRSLRSLPRGPELVEIVEAFGNVASSYLRHKDSKNEEASPPHQASRIEPYDDPKLSSEARAIYNDLLRYSVFIEDVRGKSRRGHVVPRLYLRRFLIPIFNLTFSKRDSLELSVEELVELLLRPKDFETKKRLRGPASDDDEGSPQLPFGPSGGPI
jgi:serine/threonine protein kinase